MRFEQLECLLAVEETGSFVGAAQKLFLTQQAVSMSMKQLEQELGQSLLIRENKKIIFSVKRIVKYITVYNYLIPVYTFIKHFCCFINFEYYWLWYPNHICHK